MIFFLVNKEFSVCQIRELKEIERDFTPTDLVYLHIQENVHNRELSTLPAAADMYTTSEGNYNRIEDKGGELTRYSKAGEGRSSP